MGDTNRVSIALEATHDSPGLERARIMKQHSKDKVILVGGGPAGLTAAYQLSKLGIRSMVLEKDDIVGGIARTVNYKGYRFDIGGHRFFTKVKIVEDMWHEVLGSEFLRRSRLSRIYYNSRFFYYPLRASNALLGLGFWTCLSVLMSYIKAQIFPQKPEETFEQWVSNRFGRKLYSIFFKTYTEKVWGIPCSEITAEWAAQRIKGLSLFSALKNALIGEQSKSKGGVIKTLIDAFDYPRHGPGMMWEAVADKIEQGHGEIRLESEATRLIWSEGQVQAVEIRTNGQTELVEGTHFISSMPVRELIQRLDPAVPQDVLDAAERLNYRDFLTVALVIDDPDLFPDNWIYVHDPDAKVGRIQNFKNWSPDMVPDPSKTCLGLEYFCFEGDGLWTMEDQDLIELGTRELGHLGLIKASQVVDGAVVRMPKAYPVYDSTYREALDVVREFLAGISNLQLVGRNGMHKYNNQDHSMLTAMLAVENIAGAKHDLWQVNVEQEYHEEMGAEREKDLRGLASTQPRVPIAVANAGVRAQGTVSGIAAQTSEQLVHEQAVSEQVLMRVMARMDKLGFATAVGTVSGLLMCLATLWLLVRGGDVVGPNLQLLNQYFIGYTVTFSGALIGLAHGFFWGFVWGWLVAYLRNFSLGLYMYTVRKKADLLSFKDFLDYY